MKEKLIKIFTILVFTISTFAEAEYRLGVDYRIADNPLPVKKDGVVEVMETFWYGCNACYQFDPVINKWAASQVYKNTCYMEQNSSRTRQVVLRR